MEPKNLTDIEREIIEDDKARSHAVYFLDCLTAEESAVDEKIEAGLSEINGRALAADMVILSTAYLSSSYYDGKAGHLCMTIICQWVPREVMERQQSAQRFNPNGGMGGRR